MQILFLQGVRQCLMKKAWNMSKNSDNLHLSIKNIVLLQVQIGWFDCLFCKVEVDRLQGAVSI